MGRFNKATEGVFTEIVGDSTQLSTYDSFINYGTKLSSSKDLKKFTKQYGDIIMENKNTFLKLSKLEEVIMQMRSMENIDDIKLSLVREYIYARSPFFRKGKLSKDIRVIVDKSEFYEDSVEDLPKNKAFMDKATEKLKKAMTIEIMENIHELEKIS
jgi:hypothetical protein